jgi:polyvinyl alcohol dehydrogenase (cytochrome)
LVRNLRLTGWAAGLGLAVFSGALALAADVSSLLGGDPAERPDAQSAQRGAAVYAARCASCHDVGGGRAPQKMLLSMLAPRSIEAALTSGVMKPMGQGLSDEERRSVAEYIAQKRMGPPAPPALRCAPGASPFDVSEPPPLAGWALAPGGAHAIAPAVAQLPPARAADLKLKWAFAFPNASRARSQPTLGGGAIFVGSHDGTVFALDRRTGCARWTFQAGGEVRTGISLSPWRAGDRAARPMVYFGDLVGNVYGLDARTGAQVWRIKADPHPNATITGAPVLFEGRLIVPVSSLEEATAGDPSYPCCSFRGALLALDARSGRLVWRRYMVPPPQPRGVNAAGARRLGPSGVAIWGAPTIDPQRRRIYVATGDNYTAPVTAYSDAVVALDADTGRILWANQTTPGDAWNVGCLVGKKENCPEDAGPDHDFGAPPVLAASADGQRFLLAGQKSGMVYGLDPDTGRLRWKTRVGRGGAGGGVHFGMSAQGGRLFVPVTDYTFPGEPLGHPGLYALDIKSGRVIWSFVSDACATGPGCLNGFGGAPTAVGRLVLVGGDDGWLRALDAATGAKVWAFDTTRPTPTVDGGTAKGGSISSGVGPIAYHGMLIVPSGQSFTGKKPGNLLLTFEAAGAPSR